MDKTEQGHLKALSVGNRDSFVYFHQKYQAKVYHYCLKFVRSQEVAQEITSDVFLKVWEKRASLNSDIALNGLLFKITKDLSISHLRKIAKDTALKKNYIKQYFNNFSNPVEDLLFFKEGLVVVDKAIESLPPKCKIVFRLRYFDEWSLRQIAEELNISTNTVQNHLTKGTRLVKAYLEANTDLVFALLLIQLM